MNTNIIFAHKRALLFARLRGKWMGRARAAAAEGSATKRLCVQFAREDNHSMVFWLQKAREWGAA